VLTEWTEGSSLTVPPLTPPSREADSPTPGISEDLFFPRTGTLKLVFPRPPPHPFLVLSLGYPFKIRFIFSPTHYPLSFLLRFFVLDLSYIFFGPVDSYSFPFLARLLLPEEREAHAEGMVLPCPPLIFLEAFREVVTSSGAPWLVL